MEACDIRAPYTLVGFLLAGDKTISSSSGACFSLRDYFSRAINFFLWISLVSISFLLSRKLARLLRLWTIGSRIPGPPSPSFFSGHAKLLGARGCGRDLTGYLSRLHENYGPIVRLWLGPTQLLVSVKDVAVIKEILIKAKDKYPLTGREFRLAFGRSNIFVSSFEKVQEGRNYLTTFMNERLLERVNTVPLKVVECVLGRVESAMSKGILDCRSLSQHVSFYILGAALFEEAFFNWSDATLYEELLLMISKDACYWASYKIPPFWRRKYWTYQFLCTKLRCLTQDIIQQCRYNSTITQISQSSYEEVKSIGKLSGNGGATLFGNLLSGNSSLNEGGKGHLVSTGEPFGDILGMMFHGCSTITNLLCSILTRLVLHPELQLKIFSEIKEVQQRTCNQDSYDVQKMPLLLATVYESARLLPPGRLLQRCSLNHDLHLKWNITVPAGAILVVPLELVQMDSSIWGEDAGHFNPHRFVVDSIDQEGRSQEDGILEPYKNAAYLPFGSGSRACLGKEFSVLGISTFFASLLLNYEVTLVPGSENDLNSTVNDRFQPVPSPKITFMKRNS
ncbi:uncharacterized protein A4U43_C05F490 [Asparagus officinalis]|uniref:Cytochrome P450 n=1 Tax=Asparagus officinalis TaxID=4686 RepID=A0A5P1ETT8_ASPOF|nr:probable cytochrome P450 313a4 [Asparagus officinalis]ONK67480.1 uncharacterized protein A4U43_C05F490 [Asparagus officinalis]